MRVFGTCVLSGTSSGGVDIAGPVHLVSRLVAFSVVCGSQAFGLVLTARIG